MRVLSCLAIITYLLFLNLTIISCGSDDSKPEVITPPVDLPVVTTTAVSEITDTGAKSGGTIVANGNVTARGIVWGTATAPTITLSTRTTDATGTGNFTSTITGLTSGTKYFVRAYATNEAGTAYGNEVSFTTTVPLIVLTNLDNALKANMNSYSIPALSIAIVKNEKLVYVKSYGQSDKEANTAAINSDRYRIASLSKPITQAIILKLVNEGSLSLEDKVFGEGAVLGTDFGTPPVGSNKDLITIQHLLEHKSGWRNSPNDPMFVNLDWSQSDIIKDMLANRALVTAPGAVDSYSNFGYLVLGRVIEKVTQKNYEEYVKSVFTTMGITNMQIAGNTLAERLPQEVKYYQSEFNPYGMNIHRMDSHGGWIATSTDLARFITHIDRESGVEDLVPTDLLNKTYFSYESWYHTGSLPGTSTILCRLNDDFSFVVLANTRTESNIDLILNALYNTMQSQINSNTNWPDYDLF